MTAPLAPPTITDETRARIRAERRAENERASEYERRWLAFAAEHGFHPKRYWWSCPQGRADRIMDHGFGARCLRTGLRVAIGDPYGHLGEDSTPHWLLAKGIQIEWHPGLHMPGSTRLAVLRVRDAELARSFFVTTWHAGDCLVVKQPARWLRTSTP